jgi:hypothetical protein
VKRFAPQHASTTDEAVVQLRRQLRDAYVKLLLRYPAFSLDKQVPSKLWHFFYKQIEPFVNEVPPSCARQHD